MNVPPVINIDEKLAKFSDHWNPRIISRYNDNEVRIAKLLGEFTWHSHADTDELFLVLKGTLRIEFRDVVRTVAAGEMIVVPKGVEHRPVADSECEIIVMDREGESNTGVTTSKLTRSKLEEI